jgi:hypothetical protein
LLWYGHNTLYNFKKFYKRSSYKYNLRVRTLGFPIPRRGGRSAIKLHFYIPGGWNVVLLRSVEPNHWVKLLYVYSDLYYFNLPIISSALSCRIAAGSSEGTLGVSIWNRYTPSYYRMYFDRISSVFYSFSRIIFNKMKVKGKGYKIYKTYRNTLTHQLGHSHRRYIHAYFITVKFLNKTTVFMFGFSKRDVFTVGWTLRSSRYMNIFTGRGVRFSRQLVYKKTGKVSTYR